MIATRTEITNYLGIDPSDDDGRLLTFLHGVIERRVKDFVQSNIENDDYVHYFPADDDRRNAFLGITPGFGPDVLKLPQVPVKSVASVYEDAGAYGGQAAGAWATDTLLTAGEDYFVDFNESGICKTGFVRRIAGRWCSVPRSIKVSYNAGYSAGELSGEHSAIKLAAILGVVKAFNECKSNRSTDGVGTVGPIISESLADYSVSYSDAQVAAMVGMTVDLPRESKLLLEKYLPRGYI